MKLKDDKEATDLEKLVTVPVDEAMPKDEVEMVDQVELEAKQDVMVDVVNPMNEM